MTREKVLATRQIIYNKLWTWTWQTATETYITVSPSRGFVTIEKEFPQGLPNAVLVSDSLSAQLKTKALKHQLCLAHLYRELNAFIEITKNKWPVQLKELFQKAIRLKKDLHSTQYDKPIKRRDEILLEFQDLLDKPPKTKIKKLIAFHKRMVKLQECVFTFLFYPEVFKGEGHIPLQTWVKMRPGFESRPLPDSFNSTNTDK